MTLVIATPDGVVKLTYRLHGKSRHVTVTPSRPATVPSDANYLIAKKIGQPGVIHILTHGGFTE